jgi:hypothetical protein
MWGARRVLHAYSKAEGLFQLTALGVRRASPRLVQVDETGQGTANLNLGLKLLFLLSLNEKRRTTALEAGTTWEKNLYEISASDDS